eukprot:SAG31_NODE_10288_length_1160_cov_1.448633_2_plen_296_part_01
MLHKPAGCLSVRPTRKSTQVASVEGDAAETNEDRATVADSEPSVFDLIPPHLAHRSIGPFGRLDKDTTGLLLLGSDGGLQTVLTHPASKVKKQYLATLRPGFELVSDAASQIAAGLKLPDGTQCAPAKLEVLEVFESEHPAVVRLTLHEGFNHQVKRMIGALGGFVETLHREAIGPLCLPPDLASGCMREVSLDELTKLAKLFPGDRSAGTRAEVQKCASLARGGSKRTKGRKKMKVGPHVVQTPAEARAEVAFEAVAAEIAANQLPKVETALRNVLRSVAAARGLRIDECLSVDN